MKEINVISRGIPAKSRSGNIPAGASVAHVGGGKTTVINKGSDIDVLKSVDDRLPSDVNVMSSLRILKEIASSIGLNNESLKNLFVRKDIPETLSQLLKLLGGAEFGESIDSMLAGKGTIITADGRVQTDRMEIRGSLKVFELIYNRLQAMERDYAYSESNTIESVKLMPDGTYRLTLKKEWDGDYTALQTNDVVYGIVNDLQTAGGGYHASWMRVVNVDTAGNTIDCTLYADSEVPGGKNYPPEVWMVISHRGNPTNQDRQAYWYVSSSEHCICMLDGVTKPILEESNYSIIIGRLKRLSLFTNLPINYQQSYVYCRGIAIQDLFEIDYKGVVQRREVNRMFWSLAAAQSDPYLSTETFYHVVSHYGCEWMCLVSNTLQEPKFGCSDWAMLRGNPHFSIDILSSEGWGEFDVHTFRTTLSVVGELYNQDVTENILDADVSWSRDSGNVAEDNAWTATHANYGKSLTLTKDDLGPNYITMRRCKFIATALLRDGQNNIMEGKQLVEF